MSSSNRPAINRKKELAKVMLAQEGPYVSSSTNHQHNTKTARQLKHMCITKGLLVGGNKSTLIHRLLVAEQQEQEQQPHSTSNSSSNGGQPTSAHLPVRPCLNEEATAKGKAMFDALRAALLDSKFCEDGGLLGFPCLHMYEDDNELPPQDESGELTTAGQNLRLKGADVILYIAAARLGLKPRVVRIASSEHCENKIFLDEWPSLEDARDWTLTKYLGENRAARTLTEESFLDLGVTVDFEQHEGSCKFPDDGTIKWIEYPSTSDGKFFAMKSRVLECRLLGTRRFSHKGSDTSFYAEAAVVLQIPPAKLRQAMHAATSGPPPPPPPVASCASTATTTTSSSSTTMPQANETLPPGCAVGITLAAVTTTSTTSNATADACMQIENEDTSSPKKKKLKPSPVLVPATTATTSSIAAAAAIATSKEGGEVTKTAAITSEARQQTKQKTQATVAEKQALAGAQVTASNKEEEEEEERVENMLHIPQNIDLTCFQGIQRGLSSREESAWANTRFNNYQDGPESDFTLSELQDLAEDLELPNQGTQPQLVGRIRREIEKREAQKALCCAILMIHSGLI